MMFHQKYWFFNDCEQYKNNFVIHAFHLISLYPEIGVNYGEKEENEISI